MLNNNQKIQVFSVDLEAMLCYNKFKVLKPIFID